ncbi:unnamed protein product [Blepharisma stoltei]|uniref:Ubiquitin-like domain-containing protein n=1 Tax=Blepharisma stoltei TaxID=1481888 RepID=A0AAU9IIN7_9CILI|nr:unnamed protein product [Blepharisma stoltei]
MGGKSSTSAPSPPPSPPEMVTIAVIDINCFRISKQVNHNWKFSALVKELSQEFDIGSHDLTIMFQGQAI